jgi:LPS-assembly protein
LALTLGVAAQAQTAAPASSQAAAAAQHPDKLIVEADELVYDKDHDTVSAVGAVQLYYKHRVLQADRVIYNRATKRVYAEGRAKLTDESGNVTYASRFDLTDDFAAGFAEGVKVLSTDKTRFTSPRIERSAGAVTVLNGGVYTACEPCKDHPEHPPFWQIRAARIIENQQTHMMYFEDAWFEVGGVPIAYVPYFSGPDPTVTRASGFLAPTFVGGTYTGFGVALPNFYNLAPISRRRAPSAKRSGATAWTTASTTFASPGSISGIPRCFPPPPMARAIEAGAARSKARASFISTISGNTVGTSPPSPIATISATTRSRAKTRRAISSRTSCPRSICAARRIAASSI